MQGMKTVEITSGKCEKKKVKIKSHKSVRGNENGVNEA